MQNRPLSDLSEQELARLRKSEAAMSRYAATVSEIHTYQLEADKLTAGHGAVTGEDGSLKRAQLWNLEKKAMKVFRHERQGLLASMLPEHRQKVLAECDPLIQFANEAQRQEFGRMFAAKSAQLQSSESELKADRESGWGCTIQ